LYSVFRKKEGTASLLLREASSKSGSHVVMRHCFRMKRRPGMLLSEKGQGRLRENCLWRTRTVQAGVMNVKQNEN